jgi:hypothetical protein
MKLAVLAILLIFALHSALSQSVICFFATVNGRYTCTATISNPGGWNNFTHVEGWHFGGETDDDVVRIERNAASTSPNFPSIFCSQFRNTEAIAMDRIGLERIDESSFANCRNLKDLSLTSNRIANIHGSAFSENVQLSLLDLSANQLVSLQEELFASQINLIHLYLDSNNIQELPGLIFSSLTQLNVLRLDLNEIRSFSDLIFSKLSSLSILSFSLNQITTLNPNLIQNLANLETFSISFNRISSIPPNFFGRFPLLSLVQISGNTLTVLNSNSFGYLPKFDNFWFNDNQLDAIDERIFTGRSFRTINTGPNPCADRNGTISNPNYEIIRLALQRCFDHFNQIDTTPAVPTTTISTTTRLPHECEVGNVDERICRLEVENEDLRERVERLEQIVLNLR